MAIELDDEMKDRIDGALANGTPLVVAYVDRDGAPHLSFRGSTQALSGDQLAIWVRNAAGGFPAALADNPRVALLYRDPSARRSLTLAGRARLAPELDDAVYERSPEAERLRDPEQDGVAVVVELDSVVSAGPEGVARMQRD